MLLGTEYTCEIYLPEITVYKNGIAYEILYAQSLTEIKNINKTFFILRHAVMSEFMESHMNVGDYFNIELIHKDVEIKTSENLEHRVEMLKDLKLIQYRTEHEHGEPKSYIFVFEQMKNWFYFRKEVNYGKIKIFDMESKNRSVAITVLQTS